jgi:hypothetical protein
VPTARRQSSIGGIWTRAELGLLLPTVALPRTTLLSGPVACSVFAANRNRKCGMCEFLRQGLSRGLLTSECVPFSLIGPVRRHLDVRVDWDGWPLSRKYHASRAALAAVLAWRTRLPPPLLEDAIAEAG